MICCVTQSYSSPCSFPTADIRFLHSQSVPYRTVYFEWEHKQKHTCGTREVGKSPSTQDTTLSQSTNGDGNRFVVVIVVVVVIIIVTTVL